jgi:hypothetical protein
MSRACQPLIALSSHFNTQNQDMCNDTIGTDQIKIQSQPYQTTSMPQIAHGVQIGNMHLYYKLLADDVLVDL